MSDRLAVFNHGRIEQIGTPGRDLRASRHRLRCRFRRRLQRAARASSPSGSPARRSRSRSGPRRSASGPGQRAAPTARVERQRRHRLGALPGRRHALYGRASTAAASSLVLAAERATTRGPGREPGERVRLPWHPPPPAAARMTGARARDRAAAGPAAALHALSTCARALLAVAAARPAAALVRRHLPRVAARPAAAELLLRRRLLGHGGARAHAGHLPPAVHRVANFDIVVRTARWRPRSRWRRRSSRFPLAYYMARHASPR